MLSEYKKEKPILETTRLRLRAMTRADIPCLQKWMPDEQLYRWWGKKAGKTDRNPALLFEKPEKPTLSFHWGIECLAQGEVIGECWVYLIEQNRMAKVAFRIATAQKGQGYATEALGAVVEFCFEKTELMRLWTDVDVRNAASIRVLEKCGFRREGLIRQGKMVSSWCDYYLYGLLKSDRRK